jgi:hypothetical protein
VSKIWWGTRLLNPGSPIEGKPGQEGEAPRLSPRLVELFEGAGHEIHCVSGGNCPQIRNVVALSKLLKPISTGVFRPTGLRVHSDLRTQYVPRRVR